MWFHAIAGYSLRGYFIPCYLMWFHAILRYSMLFHNMIPHYSMISRAIPYDSTLFHMIPCYSMLLHMSPRFCTWFYVIPCYSKQGILDLWFSLGIRWACGPQHPVLFNFSARCLYFHATFKGKCQLPVPELVCNIGPSDPEMLVRGTIILGCCFGNMLGVKTVNKTTRS